MTMNFEQLHEVAHLAGLRLEKSQKNKYSLWDESIDEDAWMSGDFDDDEDFFPYVGPFRRPLTEIEEWLREKYPELFPQQRESHPLRAALEDCGGSCGRLDRDVRTDRSIPHGHRRQPSRRAMVCRHHEPASHRRVAQPRSSLRIPGSAQA
ncbi:hypothetical protein, partial [Mycobacterium sp.]|uniref:hypothetical protein n=1 Tax=Mycobacterium sp. TaxID=1785 RepID=UPI003C71E08D